MTWSCRVAATVLKRRDEILLNSILLFFSNFILYFGIEMMPANWHLVSPYMIPKYQTLKKMFKEENIDLWFFCERWIHVRWNHVDLTHRGKVMMKAKEKTKIIYKIYILTFITYLLDNDRVKFSLSRTINHQNKKKTKQQATASENERPTKFIYWIGFCLMFTCSWSNIFIIATLWVYKIYWERKKIFVFRWSFVYDECIRSVVQLIIYFLHQ